MKAIIIFDNSVLSEVIVSFEGIGRITATSSRLKVEYEKPIEIPMSEDLKANLNWLCKDGVGVKTFALDELVIKKEYEQKLFKNNFVFGGIEMSKEEFKYIVGLINKIGERI